MASVKRPLPLDVEFPSTASDWLTAERSPDVIFRDGKWWTSTHYVNWKKDVVSDQLRVRRGRSIKTFLDSQPNSF